MDQRKVEGVRDMEMRRSTGSNKVPVGVFEAYVGLFELISVLQLRHILSVDRRLCHGLLGEKKEKRGGGRY